VFETKNAIGIVLRAINSSKATLQFTLAHKNLVLSEDCFCVNVGTGHYMEYKTVD
jgi:hypothetical protein